MFEILIREKCDILRRLVLSVPVFFVVLVVESIKCDRSSPNECEVRIFETCFMNDLNTVESQLCSDSENVMLLQKMTLTTL